MKIYISLFLYLSVFVFSCDIIDDKTIDSDEATFYFDADFEKIGKSINIVPGDDLLFMRVNSYDEPGIFDEQYTEKFAFTVDKNTGDSFTIAENEIEDLNLYYDKSCYCPPTGDYRLKSGTIIGTKLSADGWDLDIDVILEIGYPFYEGQIVVDTVYTESPYQHTGIFQLDNF